MSARRLPRELGIVILCNAEGCGCTFRTANVRIKVNRRAAAQVGWIRGGVTGMRRFDYCPEHAVVHRELIATRKREREEERKARDAVRLAKKTQQQPAGASA